MPLPNAATLQRRELERPAPRTVPLAALPAFGARSAFLRDNLYWFGQQGVLYTSPWIATPSTERQAAVLLLSVSGEPFELTLGGRVHRLEAAAIAPLTRRGLRAVDVGLVSVNIQPRHDRFGAFCRISGGGILALPREIFARFDGALLRAYEGRLAHGEARQLFEGLSETAAAQLPGSGSRDPRAELLHELLRVHPELSLGDLARELGVSYTGASHLFSRAMGLPFRAYQHWLKCMRATEFFPHDVKLTEIAHKAGFSDLPHLSRAWQHRFGLPPTYLRDRTHVRIFR